MAVSCAALLVLLVSTAPSLAGRVHSHVSTKVHPELEPESHDRFFHRDYPDDHSPKVTGHFGHPYPEVQDSDKFDKDYVEDRNDDGGYWDAQMKYDNLKNKLRKEKQDVVDAMKDEVKQKQLQEDLRMMREYQEMMMQQEIKRQEDLRKRVEKQKILQDRMEQTTHAVEANDKAEQEKVERERADIAARALELDRNKVEKQKKLTDETQAFLFQQMEGKADLAKRSQEQKLEAARLLEMDTKDYHDAEKLKADQRRAQNVAHRQELERQIALRSKPYPGIGIGKKVVGSDYAMSETEMRMNRNLVKQVKATLAENSARMGLTGLSVES
jgi:hypothetical protein